ncbi:MAG: 2-oxo-hepta-3-ene-1,7-dioic acid hydratase, partial [Pseudomonadota bacterium]
MTPQDHARAAADLLNAERTGQQIGLLTLQHPTMGIQDAYAVQNAIYAAKLAEGRKVVGWKIGLTSKAMQYALNIDIPDSGILFDDMVFDHDSTVPKGRFIQPRIEAEIAFVMKDAIGGDDVTREDVIAATAYVAPSIEILDTRILRVDPETGKTR